LVTNKAESGVHERVGIVARRSYITLRK